MNEKKCHIDYFWVVLETVIFLKKNLFLFVYFFIRCSFETPVVDWCRNSVYVLKKKLSRFFSLAFFFVCHSFFWMDFMVKFENKIKFEIEFQSNPSHYWLDFDSFVNGKSCFLLRKKNVPFIFTFFWAENVSFFLVDCFLAFSTRFKHY